MYFNVLAECRCVFSFLFGWSRNQTCSTPAQYETFCLSLSAFIPAACCKTSSQFAAVNGTQTCSLHVMIRRSSSCFTGSLSVFYSTVLLSNSLFRCKDLIPSPLNLFALLIEPLTFHMQDLFFSSFSFRCRLLIVKTESKKRQQLHSAVS